MVGDSKILTVSYGTFSCTLEGFDDPFSTMKAIAEYFRDLAADDRYFGAEPPTPDAQMLHQIAEREVQRRVEAKIQENGVVLKAGAQTAPEALPFAATAAAAPVATGTESHQAAAPAEVAAEEEPEPQPAPEPEYTASPGIESPLEPDSVAAKLLRIRAAVAQARDSGTAVPAAAAAPAAVQAETGLRPHLTAVEDVPEDSDFEADAPAAALPEATIPAEAFEAPEETAEEESTSEAELEDTAEAEAPADTPDEAATEETLAQETPVEEAPAQETSVEETASEDATVDAAPAEDAPVEEASIEEPAADVTPFETEQAEEASVEATEEDEPADLAQDDEAAVSLANIMAAAAAHSAPQDTADEEDTTDEPVLEDTVGSFLTTLGDDTVEEETAPEAVEDVPAAEDETPAEDKTEEGEPTAEATEDESDADEYEAGMTGDSALETAEEEVATEEAPAQSLLARARARIIKVRRIENGAPEIFHEEDEPAQEAPAEEATAEDTVEEETPAEEAPAEEIRDEDAPEEAAALPEAPEEEYEDEGELAAEDHAEAHEDGEEAPHAKDAGHEFAEDGSTGDEDADHEEIAAEADTSDEEEGAVAALSPEDEAELQAELQAVEREVEAHRRADRGGRNLLEAAEGGADDSMNRLMRQTEDHLEDAESRRRLSTIAHLKAAVAAREADRELGEDGDDKQEDALRSYRDDLARVVRPRRPVAEGSATRRPAAPADRPAPLVLVSEQRIDRPSEARPAAQPIRPRRIAAGNLAVDESDDEDDYEDETGNVFTDSNSFAEFAERIGATALPDLLEAAAAYSNCVEGREHFTRPEIMRFAAVAGREMGTEAGEGFSREAGLRSFGMLLREGKIKKIKRGQFAISQSSRFITEARKIAR